MTGLIGRIAGLFKIRERATDTNIAEHALEPISPSAPEVRRVITAICAEVARDQRYRGGAVRLGGIGPWERLKNGPAAMQVAVALNAVIHKRHGGLDGGTIEETRRTIASQLFRKKLPFTGDQLASPIRAWAEQPHLQYGMAGLSMIGAAERLLDGQAPEGALRGALEKLRRRLTPLLANQPSSEFDKTLLARVKALLEPDLADRRTLPPGPFAKSLAPWLAALDATDRDAWQALLAYAAGTRGKSRPAAKWVVEGQGLVDSVGEAVVAAQMIAWMEATTPDPTKADPSLDILRGLVWLGSAWVQPGLTGAVGRFAERCFRKVSGLGARSVKLGNAALWTLAASADVDAAAAELFRLRARLKLPSTRKLLDELLTTMAGRLGRSLADLEDGALPTFGLARDGMSTHRLGEFTASIVVDAADVEIRWQTEDKRSLKTVPAAVQRDHKAELTSIRQAAKDIEAARAAQALRLEQSWLEDRHWDASTWRRTFLDHPLRRQVAHALIWRFEGPDGAFDAMPQGDCLLTLSGGAPPPAAGTVRLWHPLDSDPDQVLAWRDRIVALDLTQPIKQAHREVYVLTDAERGTDTYSNRFAAHILRQHQFRALCQARGWSFDFLGGWDSDSIPTRPVPHYRLHIQYYVDPVHDGQRSAAYVPLHLTTDRIRFLDNEGRAVSLETVPPIIFSEMLRDVDLFVSVTSVANDPAWTDGGPDGRFGDYWRSWAFGDLGQSAETRRTLITAIVPKLAIADRLEVTDKALVVQGQRHRYAIHFGSGNIQILPSNRYLCIVPGRPGKHSETIKLPFTGDSLVSIILSKAFLLVDESKITDRTILTQL